MFKDINHFIETLRTFNTERNWSQFHSPKNLAICYVAEVNELVELLYPLTVQQSLALTEDKGQRYFLAISELADCFRNLVLLADSLDSLQELPSLWWPPAPIIPAKETVALLAQQANLLLQPFMWCTEEQSAALRHRNRPEGQKVLNRLKGNCQALYQVARSLEVDLLAIAAEKHREIELKYPVEKAFGSSAKYTDHAHS